MCLRAERAKSGGGVVNQLLVGTARVGANDHPDNQRVHIESIGLCGFELLLIALFEALPQALKFYSLVNLLGK